MKTSHTFSILFWINKSRAIKNKAEIFVRVTANGKRANIGIKRKIDIDLWDNQNKKVKGKTKESQEINRYLNLVQARLLSIHQDLKYKGELITPQLVKSLYNGENINSKTLLELLEYHNRKIENTLAPGTIRNFGITENYINRFLKKNLKTTDVYLRQLNYKFISDLEMFLVNYYPKGHPKAMGHNTVMKHLQRLRKIINLAYQLEWIDRDPFLRWKPTFEQKQREFLNANELNNLETYNFLMERLDRVRDLFVFSCYTGISYSDIMELTNNNLIVGTDGNNWIVTKRLKTKTSVRVPLLKPAKKILAKYKEHPVTVHSGTLLPKPLD
ncbi:MAG: site-specific integrase [Allomuricauda sp.]